jgi:hypothetical protein
MAKNSVEYNISLDASVTSAVKKVEKQVAELEKNITDINKTPISPKVSGKTKSGFKGLSKSVGDVQSKMAGFASGIPGVGGSLSGLVSAINPVTAGLAVLSAAVVGVGTHLIGVQKEIDNTRSSFSRFVDASNLNAVVSKATALRRVFKDLDEKELAQATKTLQKEFGVSGVEALALLEKSLIATNGAIDLDNVKEYASQIKKTGGSAEDLLAIISLSENEGFYQDKGIDAVKEFNLRFSEMGKGAEDALKAVGINGKELQEQVANGTLTQKEAFNQIFGEMDKLDAKSQQILTAGILGAPGEDLGVNGIMAIANMEQGLDGLIAKQGASAKRQQKILDLNTKLAESQVKTAKTLRPLFQGIEEMWLRAQIAFAEFLNPIIEWIVDVGTDLANIFGPSLIEKFKMIGSAIKIAFIPFVLMMKAIKGTIRLISQMMTGLRKFATFLGTVVKKAITNVLGQDMIDDLKLIWESLFTFIGAKWNQLSTMMKATFDAISEGLAGNFEASAKAFEKAKEAGKALFSGSTIKFEKEGGEDTAPEDKGTGAGTGTGTDQTLDTKINGNIDNAVQGATSSVNNITLNLDSLQHIENQTISNGGEAGDVSNELQQLLLQTANDVNQTGGR